MLCKTEWSWELWTWSQHKMNLLDILSTSPHYFCRKKMGATNENSNFDLRVWRVKERFNFFAKLRHLIKKLYTMYSKMHHASFKLTQSWKKCMMNRFLAETVTYRVPRHINIQNNIKCWWLKWPTQLFIHAARKCQGNFNNLVQLQPKLIYKMACFQFCQVRFR